MSKSNLSLKDTIIAIKYIKDQFENTLSKKLNLLRVSAPLFVTRSSGLNDSLTGKEEPVSFHIKGIDDNIEIVHSLAKWKRYALAKYNIDTNQGIYADMNAIRKDEEIDNIHSVYVDQWDYEIIIKKEERNLKTLFSYVRKIYSIILSVEKKINNKYSCLSNKLPKKIFFISSLKLERMYPHLSPKERENEICKEYGAVFIYKIGWNLKNKKPHDLRAPDYDDWNLNGDILVYDKIINSALELSSMGIRVDEESIIKQLKFLNKEEQISNDYVQSVINKKLPYTIGGGIGQSRLCMFYLEKKHIGEVQASIWKEDKNELEKDNIILL